MGPYNSDQRFENRDGFTEAELTQYERTKLNNETFKQWKERNKAEKERRLALGYKDDR